MLDSEAVANYFLQKSFETGVPLSQLKLLKLVYIAHGWHRGYLSINLINDAVQAWRYGPVIPDLYRKIKHYGRRTIDAPVHGFGVAGDSSNPWPTQRSQALVDRVWDVYKGFSAIQLSAMTHEAGTPWDETWREAGGDNYSGPIIPNQLIDQHYKAKIEAQPAHDDS